MRKNVRIGDRFAEDASASPLGGPRGYGIDRRAAVWMRK
jgi:hypothetical protein